MVDCMNPGGLLGLASAGGSRDLAAGRVTVTATSFDPKETLEWTFVLLLPCSP
jgi:hypothetical protein